MNSRFQHADVASDGKKPRKSRGLGLFGLLALIAALSLPLAGCLNDDIVPTDDETDAIADTSTTDTGTTGQTDGSDPMDAGSAIDATTANDVAAHDTAATDAAPTDTGSTDAGSTDTGAADTGAADTGAGAECKKPDDCLSKASPDVCHVWMCESGKCAQQVAAEGTSCKGPDACNPGQCSAGKCKTSPKTCADDKNPCTDDACDKAKGCVYTANTKSCDDGDPCTEGDTCANKACKAGTAKKCDDKNPCTADTCDKAKGCTTKNNAEKCDDGNKCTEKDLCNGGKCAGTELKCDDGKPCTKDSCDKAKGCVSKLDNSLKCDDGDKCTSNDACNDGKCAGQPAACDDKNPCTADTCDANKGGCVHAPTKTDLKPTGRTVSFTHKMAGGVAVDNFGNMTIGHDLGKQRWYAAYAKDGKTLHKNNNAYMVNGMDVHQNVIWAVSNKKKEIYTIDKSWKPAKKFSTAGWTAMVPYDIAFDKGGNAWILFSQGLSTTNTEAWQIDQTGKKLKSFKLGVASWSIEVTKSGLFVGDLNGKKLNKYSFDGKLLGSVALPGKAYDVESSGDDLVWVLSENSGKLLVFDGALKKQLEFSVPKAAYRIGFHPQEKKVWISHINGAIQYALSIATCDDGNACTAGDSCNDGKCGGSPANCDDGNACTADSCDATKGGCQTKAVTGSCDDGSVCTENDTCSAKVCKAGAAKTCDDKNVCTADSCDPKKGCLFAVAAKKPCDDGNPCTTSDVCGFDKSGNASCVGQDKVCATGQKCDANTGKCSVPAA